MIRWVAGLACVLATAAAPAFAQCRQALVLALDVSGSVDATEYRLQLDGVARALLHPDVEAALLMIPSAPVRLMVFEWSTRHHQRQIVGWTDITDRDDIARVAGILQATRAAPVENPSTAIGEAMIYGTRELNAQRDCWQKTLDISGDGPANLGLHPQEVPDKAVGDVIINGLVIGPNSPANINKNRHNLKTLMEYYEAYVLRGTGSFAEPAMDFQDFENAMRRKLIRELQPPAVSQITTEPAHPG
ncbi:MAG: DUF1194 domain-containing protein [Pseudomonadota bacterium]